MGVTTTNEAENIIACIGKVINKLPQIEVCRFGYYNLLKQFKTRKLNIQYFFLKINWNIVLATTSTITTFIIIIWQFSPIQPQ
ncbi:hypothetical protein PVAND_001398 [Polypedilum vanderplanki]|uniref:Uncharacterized protein n=1 Tax=Polypedilum vanderplanki TaxID=319348 RepID=A0A9J6BP51_POLVA|nr:hypothetical protein PVAND_001398 [Polypedilum vanderplanki]